MKIGGSPYAIQFTNFGGNLVSKDALDLLYEAQYDILLEMAATSPSQDRSIGEIRAWTSDFVHLSISSDNNRIVHSVCALYLAAIVRLWGFKWGFRKADLEFLERREGASLSEIIGRGRISSVDGTVES